MDSRSELAHQLRAGDRAVAAPQLGAGDAVVGEEQELVAERVQLRHRHVQRLAAHREHAELAHEAGARVEDPRPAPGPVVGDEDQARADPGQVLGVGVAGRQVGEELRAAGRTQAPQLAPGRGRRRRERDAAAERRERSRRRVGVGAEGIEVAERSLGCGPNFESRE
ncbi:MAG: hypothetical protein R3F56_08205 [Planctomycetota bacterium]